MRDVTPVEALDRKLAIASSARHIRSLLTKRGEEHVYRKSLGVDLSMLAPAIPVAWSAGTHQAVLAASASYPSNQWPVLPSETSLRLHVLPSPIGEGIGVILVGVVVWRGEVAPEEHELFDQVIAPDESRNTVFVFRGYRWHEDYRVWDPAVGLTFPVNATLEEIERERLSPHGRGTELSGETRRAIMTWTFSAWAFLDQRIAVEERATVERMARRRAERADIEPVVHVVRFRKSEARSRQIAGPLDVEWSCQWLVRGHWRNQWHPRMQRHAPVWITPHIKGPADMPLKTPAPEVWQVAR